MKEIHNQSWSMTFHPTPGMAIVTLTVRGEPDVTAARAIGEAFVAYSKEVNGAWACVADLREMQVASPAARDAWLANMRQMRGLGMARWSVVNREAVPAIQANNVALGAQLGDVTLLTTDLKKAVAWCEQYKSEQPKRVNG